MRYLNIFYILTIFAGLTFIQAEQTFAQNNDLPWGKTQEPTLITPDEKETSEEPEEYTRKNPLPSENDSDAKETYPDRRASDRYRERETYGEKRDYDNNANRRYEEDRRYHDKPPTQRDIYTEKSNDTYGDDEILNAGHRFFGKVSKGLARVIAHAFSEAGRPNGYILGEDAGGAFVAGLRYGEGTMITKHFGNHKVYWQGPSIGYDFGAEGSKTMILVYNLRHPNELYRKYAGVNGSAYIVGGVGLTFQRRGRVVLARIQSGVGLRLGANVGYLKYTRKPTWNPF